MAGRVWDEGFVSLVILCAIIGIAYAPGSRTPYRTSSTSRTYSSYRSYTYRSYTYRSYTYRSYTYRSSSYSGYSGYTSRYSSPTVRYSRAYIGYYGYYYYYYSMYYYFNPSGSYYLNRQSSGSGSSVCQNYEANQNGSTLGTFTCPMPFEPSNFKSCCGYKQAEYCYKKSKSGIIAGIVIAVIIVVVVIIITAVCCVNKKKRDQKRVQPTTVGPGGYPVAGSYRQPPPQNGHNQGPAGYPMTSSYGQPPLHHGPHKGPAGPRGLQGYNNGMRAPPSYTGPQVAMTHTSGQQPGYQGYPPPTSMPPPYPNNMYGGPGGSGGLGAPGSQGSPAGPAAGGPPPPYNQQTTLPYPPAEQDGMPAASQ